jgi:predicted ABC-class ATPase
MAHSSNQAVESLRKEQKEQRKEEKQMGGSAEKQLDKALKDTFPASDPVAPQSPVKAGAPEQRKG